jgi:integrase/recombinase XerC
VHSKPLADLADLHLLALAAEHASPATVTLYRHVLGLYRAWLSERLGKPPTVAHLTADTARRWAVWLAEGDRKPNTCRHYQRIVKTHSKWLATEGILPSDPLRTVRLAREEQAEPRVITGDELARLVAACTLTLQPLRNKAIIALLADSGIRVSGLCGLDHGDVTMPTARQDHGSAHIRLKGGDHRAFPFGRKTAAAIRNYTVLERTGSVDGPLFLGRAGQRVTVKMIERMLREVTLAAGIVGKATNPHGLRHYAGTSWAAQGLNALQVRDRLGHKSLDTSLRYVHLAQRDQGYRSALDEADAVNPRLFREQGA